jgi:hypothetical protein
MNDKRMITEMVCLLSEAIDIIRNSGAEDKANWIETQMENNIKHYKETE